MRSPAITTKNIWAQLPGTSAPALRQPLSRRSWPPNAQNRADCACFERENRLHSNPADFPWNRAPSALKTAKPAALIARRYSPASCSLYHRARTAEYSEGQRSRSRVAHTKPSTRTSAARSRLITARCPRTPARTRRTIAGLKNGGGVTPRAVEPRPRLSAPNSCPFVGQQ